MARRKSFLNKRTASMSWEEAVYLTALGGKPRPDFARRDYPLLPAVRITRVLCCFCREYHSPDEVERCMAIPRPTVTANGDSSSSWTAKMPTWLSQFPELWEFLSKPFYSDGKPRQLGKISFGLNSSGLQMTLTDPSSSTYCSRNYPTMEDALLAFELGLSEGSLTWRKSSSLKGHKTR